MSEPSYRQSLINYIREQAKPPDKFSHQPRLFALACQLAEAQPFDEEVVFAAVWLHDLGVFVGHRPEEPVALASWDHTAYAMRKSPALLRRFGFPAEKIPAVVEAIRTHQVAFRPTTFEGALIRDADILEQLGAVGILRLVSKVGRDTRYVRIGDALRKLWQDLEELSAQLQLASARRLAPPRVATMRVFLESVVAEAARIEW